MRDYVPSAPNPHNINDHLVVLVYFEPYYLTPAIGSVFFMPLL